MKPLLVLLLSTISAGLLIRIFSGSWNLPAAGRAGMAAMLLFTAIGHFAFTKGMTMMLPPAVPMRKGIVLFTGLLEIAAGVALLFPETRIAAGIFLLLFFLLLLPANIYAAMRGVDYQRGTFDGPGLRYLWFRVPLQILFILWTAWCSGLPGPYPL